MHNSEHGHTEGFESGQHRRHPDRIRRRRIARGVMYVVILGACGFGWWQVTLKGYELAKGYIDQSVEQVRQENALNVQQLEDRISTLNQEIGLLRENLSDTGSTISNSAEVQERIDDHLEKLDKQLKELEGSLKILKEAPNGN